MSDKVLWVRGGAGRKRAYARTAFRQLTCAPQIEVRPRSNATRQSTSGAKNIIVLHGWSLDHSGVSDLTRALENTPTARDWNFWDVSYDTQWTPFPISAARIATALQNQHDDFSQTILVGYSMGGVVARQMIVVGFEFSALVSICTPHEGFLPWIVAFGRGPRSIARNSRALRALHNSGRDRAARHKFHLFALTYSDALGHHQHDGIVGRSSALGAHLGTVAQRITMQLRYRKVATYDPHWRGKDPQHVAPAMHAVEQLMGA